MIRDFIYINIQYTFISKLCAIMMLPNGVVPCNWNKWSNSKNLCLKENNSNINEKHFSLNSRQKHIKESFGLFMALGNVPKCVLQKSLVIRYIQVNGKVSTRIAKITQSQHMDTNYNVIYVSDNFLLLWWYFWKLSWSFVIEIKFYIVN